MGRELPDMVVDVLVVSSFRIWRVSLSRMLGSFDNSSRSVARVSSQESWLFLEEGRYHSRGMIVSLGLEELTLAFAVLNQYLVVQA